MKKRILVLGIITVTVLLLQSFNSPPYWPTNQPYIVVAWNDLGMHCANQDFQNMCVLPPYNNIKAQVIKRGSASMLPQVMTTGFNITYEIPGNTYSVGKTNFWSYEFQLFGVNLPDNIGLTGAGLTGQMEISENYFKKEGIPITPYTDANLLTEDPFQLALINLYDNNNTLLAYTQPVVPVSNEINCVSMGCHTSENSIIMEHPLEGGFDPNNRPILCASCHSSNALGTPGTPGLASFSEIIHEKHKELAPDCYKCHPGPNTQCHRDVMHIAGMVCQDCHGTVAEVAESIKNGREPWLQEPSCGSVSCHGSNYAEEPGLLFRQSRGHGGLFCSVCHGSPHAIVPTVTDRDNVQNITLQGFEGTLKRCELCHGVVPAGPGPHGIMPPSTQTQVNLIVNLEGPFSGTEMYTLLNSGSILPLSQPYNGTPWNYTGPENVSIIPNANVVDWVLVELRETNGEAPSATSGKVISRRAGFLLKNGSIVDTDGSNPLDFIVPVYTNLYPVVWHRNHLSVMSSIPVSKVGNVYTYDFTTSVNQVYGGITGHKQLIPGTWGMISGDGNSDGVVSNIDKNNVWQVQVGLSGYLNGDFNMNGQVDNVDKNNKWKPNSGFGSQVPN